MLAVPLSLRHSSLLPSCLVSPMPGMTLLAHFSSQVMRQHQFIKYARADSLPIDP